MPRSHRNVAGPRMFLAPDARRNRHGHGAKGPVTGPHLPLLENRIEQFETVVAATADYLKGLWPSELADVRFATAAAPRGLAREDGVERWHVDRDRQRIVMYRVPIQRLSKLHRNDEIHHRMLVESCVFRAVADYLGRDPWDLAPERFRFF